MILTPVEAMRLAIKEASKGAGFVSPNPLVGCAIVSEGGELLSVGHHARLGSDHAEIAALKAIPNPRLLEGARLFVTLEPCAHHGRTPPCSEHLAKLPLKKVYYGLVDPNRKVSGQGLEKLRAAGIEVENLPELEGELEDLAEVFLFNQRHQRAFTMIKVATTLDGQMAERSRGQQWLTGEEARLQVHMYRASYDAVAVGVGTFLADDPRLDIRHPDFLGKTNRVMVVDPDGEGLSKLPQSRLWKHHRPEDIIWICKASGLVPENLRGSGLKVWASGENLDWNEISKRAFDEGICSIMVEGGAGLIGTLLSGYHAQRWSQFLAPDLMGLERALNVGAHFGADGFSGRQRLIRPLWREFGRDLFLTGRLPER